MTLQHTDNTNVTNIEQEPAQESSKASGEGLTATYSPEDNKLRLYPAARLDRATYDRVKAAGFIWAAVQGCFVAPAWSPEREDLATELAGEIGDEDVSLVDRAEQRAERFGGYGEKRRGEAVATREAAKQLADGIPFGQPILIGHHSAARARRDAQKIENGMRKAVSLWHTAEYWTRRAAGAVRLAKYKERPDVRHRRVKRIEADARKFQRIIDDAGKNLRAWGKVQTIEQATWLANVASVHVPVEGQSYGTTLWSLLNDGKIELAAAIETAKAHHSARIEPAQRWVDHLAMRKGYELAMLQEGGGLVAEQFDIQPGGMVLVGGEWLTVLRVTRRDGQVLSVTTNARYVPKKGIEQVKDYRAPTEDQAAAVTKASKLAPLVNYPGDGFAHMTKAEYQALGEWSRHVRAVKASDSRGPHRQRMRMAGGCKLECVYLVDVKRVDPPAPPADPAEASPALPREQVGQVARSVKVEDPEQAEFRAMADTLRTGAAVQVVTAPQLFPTPAHVAGEMVKLAQLGLADRVLEPSAGTGALLDAIQNAKCRPESVEAVEISPALCQRLRARNIEEIHEGDFLSMSREQLGYFDRVLMNPPFAHAADIAHIHHALTFLRPGGWLVAICAAGPRQHAALQDLAIDSGGSWKELPEGTFANAGTNVRTILLSIRA